MAKDIKLTENFKLSEFCDPKKVNDYQIELLTVLAKEMQLVRDLLQDHKSGDKPVTIKITSGVRTNADITRLKKQGYHPSENSDHLCGLQPNGLPTLGAADITVSNCKLSMKEIALLIQSEVNQDHVCFGQVIYEKNPKTGNEWIHLGNDPELIFSFANNIASVIKRKKFLMSTDNGKTYRALK